MGTPGRGCGGGAVSPQLAQEPRWLPEPVHGTPEPVKRPHRATGRQQRPLHAVQATARYEPARLTPAHADHQTLAALTTAGLQQHVSRVLTEPAAHLPDCLATVALLRVGADPEAVHAALLGLTDVVGSHCGQASVSIYRATLGA